MLFGNKKAYIHLWPSASKTKIKNSILTITYLNSKYLELKNAKIYSEKRLIIETKNVVGENFTFETTGEKIIIGTNAYYKKPKQDKLIITKNDFLTPNTTLVANTNFIVFLNKLKEELLNQKQEVLTQMDHQLMKKRIKDYKMGDK